MNVPKTRVPRLPRGPVAGSQDRMKPRFKGDELLRQTKATYASIFAKRWPKIEPDAAPEFLMRFETWVRSEWRGKQILDKLQQVLRDLEAYDADSTLFDEGAESASFDRRVRSFFPSAEASRITSLADGLRDALEPGCGMYESGDLWSRTGAAGEWLILERDEPLESVSRDELAFWAFVLDHGLATEQELTVASIMSSLELDLPNKNRAYLPSEVYQVYKLRMRHHRNKFINAINDFGANGDTSLRRRGRPKKFGRPVPLALDP